MNYNDMPTGFGSGEDNGSGSSYIYGEPPTSQQASYMYSSPVTIQQPARQSSEPLYDYYTSSVDNNGNSSNNINNNTSHYPTSFREEHPQNVSNTNSNNDNGANSSNYYASSNRDGVDMSASGSWMSGGGNNNAGTRGDVGGYFTAGLVNAAMGGGGWGSTSGDKSAPQPQPGSYGSGGGDGFGSNDIMMEFGRQNMNAFVARQERSFMQRYVPFLNELRIYFHVDHNYVLYKLLLLLIPFSHAHLDKRFACARAVPLSANTGSLGASASNNPTAGVGTPTSTPTGPFVGTSNFSGATGTSPPQSSNSTPSTLSLNFQPPPGAGMATSQSQPTAIATQTPRSHLFALDLYIPTMAVLTYVILSGVSRGLAHHRLSVDDLVGSLWFLIWLLGIEVVVVIAVARFVLLLPRGASPPLLDALSLSGMKLVVINIVVLTRVAVLDTFFGDNSSATTPAMGAIAGARAESLRRMEQQQQQAGVGTIDGKAATTVLTDLPEVSTLSSWSSPRTLALLVLTLYSIIVTVFFYLKTIGAMVTMERNSRGSSSISTSWKEAAAAAAQAVARDGGGASISVSLRAKPLVYGWTGVQVLVVLWLTLRPY